MALFLAGLALMPMVRPATALELEPKKTIKKDAFDSLPGVKEPEPLTSQKFKAACTSSIRSAEWGRRPNVRMPVRVYSCEDGAVTIESTKPPMEYDWEVYKKRLQP
jgi:hypothetical protein